MQLFKRLNIVFIVDLFVGTVVAAIGLLKVKGCLRYAGSPFSTDRAVTASPITATRSAPARNPVRPPALRRPSCSRAPARRCSPAAKSLRRRAPTQQPRVVQFGQRLAVLPCRALQAERAAVLVAQAFVELHRGILLLQLCRHDGRFGLFHAVAVRPQGHGKSQRDAPELLSGTSSLI